jgi:autotransporter-associated beta strand protein
MVIGSLRRHAVVEGARYAIAIAIVFMIADPASGQTTVTWNGSNAGNANWSVTGNWNPATTVSGSVVLVFGSGGSATTSFNDVANLTVTSGTITGLARTITGSAINLGGTITHNLPGESTLGMNMLFNGANRNMTVTSGTLVLSGTLSNGGLVKAGAGLLRVTTANEFNGIFINAGVLEATVIANSGVASSVGNGTGNVPVGNNTNSGTLRYIGATNASTNRQMALGTLGSSANVLTSAVDNNGAGTLTFTNATFNASVSATAGRLLVLGGTNTGLNEIQGVIGNNSQPVSLSKNGSGRWVLSGVNSYTGSTSVTAGTLQIGSGGSINSTSGITIDGATAELRYNSATALAKSLTLTQGTLSGTGTIGAGVTFAAGDFLSPGNSPGEQSYTSLLDWDPLGTYRWELNSLAGTAGTNWDLVNVTSGTFDLSGLSAGAGGKFVLDLITLAADNSAGPLATPYSGGSHTFRIASYDPANFLLPTGFTNTANADLTGLFSISLANWQGTKPDAGNISVRINSATNGIDLVIVPEPGTVIFAGIGIAMAGWSLWKRRRHTA